MAKPIRIRTIRTDKHRVAIWEQKRGKTATFGWSLSDAVPPVNCPYKSERVALKAAEKAIESPGRYVAIARSLGIPKSWLILDAEVVTGDI